MRITPIVIQRFREWIEEKTREAGIDPAVLGLTTMDDESIRKFLKEYCSGLEYKECLSHILDIFPVLKVGITTDEEAIALAQQELNEYFGTPYISVAFKEFCKRYSHKEIQDMLMNIKGTELEVFLDYLKAKYGACDLDIRMVNELAFYGVKIQHLKYGDEKLFVSQLFLYQRYKITTNILDLVGYAENIAVAHKNLEAYVLIAIIDSTENIILPVTQSIPGRYLVVVNNANKYVGILY